MADHISNEMIQRNFEEISIRLNKQDGILEKILEQTTKTNGRVTALESGKADVADINSLKVWRGAIGGGIAVLCAMIVPLLLNILKK